VNVFDYRHEGGGLGDLSECFGAFGEPPVQGGACRGGITIAVFRRERFHEMSQPKIFAQSDDRRIGSNCKIVTGDVDGSQSVTLAVFDELTDESSLPDSGRTLDDRRGSANSIRTNSATEQELALDLAADEFAANDPA
jgi:hypothetical protein